MTRPKPPMDRRPVTVSPDRYEANGQTNGVTAVCSRCRQPREFGKPCADCEWRGVP